MGENSGKFFYDDAAPAGNRRRDTRGSAAEDGERATAAADGVRLSAGADGEDAITMEDVAAIQSIGRKSVNDFSGDEIRTAEPFARRYWRELGVKSPFFRAWFGDWRANDRTKVDMATEPGDARGRTRNVDTGWDINVSGKVFNETRTHTGSANIHARDYMPYINDIVKKAVLLDSYGIAAGKAKSGNTLLMHSMYAVADIGRGPEIIKLYVEEMRDVNSADTTKRAYQLQNIEYQQPSAKGSSERFSPVISTADIKTISDLHAAVKQKDKNFRPKSVHPALLNEDGTPKVFYHGTGSEFYEFSTEQIGAREGSFFFAENPEDAAGYGRNVMPVYLSAQNLADYDAQPSEFYRLENKRAQVAYLKERGYDGWYADMDSGGWGEISVFSPEQIKSATDNIGTFDRRNQNIRFSQKADEGTESAPGEAKRQGVDGRTFTYEEFMERYRDGVEVVRVRELNTFPSPADRRSLPSSALREARRNGNPKNTAGRAYIYFPDTGTNAYVDENSFRHGNATYDTQYALACMNATKIAQSALAVNTLEQDNNHRTDATVYLAIAEDKTSRFIVRFIVAAPSKKASMDVLYAVKKEGTFSPSADSYFTAPTSQGDAAKDSLRKANVPRRASSYKINIADFLQAVNGTAAGNAVLPLDVLRRLGTGRSGQWPPLPIDMAIARSILLQLSYW